VGTPFYEPSRSEIMETEKLGRKIEGIVNGESGPYGAELLIRSPPSFQPFI